MRAPLPPHPPTHAHHLSSGDVKLDNEQEKKDAWDYNVNTPLKPVKPVYSKE